MFMRTTLLTAALIVFALPLTASAAPVIFQAARANAAAIRVEHAHFLKPSLLVAPL